MFLCFRCLWSAISSWSGCEYLLKQLIFSRVMKNAAATLRDSPESRSSSPDPLNPLLISLNVHGGRAPGDLVGQSHRQPYSGASSPAVPFGDFFDSQTDLVAEISAGVHDPEGAFSQNHPLSVLIVFIIILRGTAGEISI